MVLRIETISVNEIPSIQMESPSSDEDMEQNPQSLNAKRRLERVWEFLHNLIKDPQYCPSLIQWEDYETKKFRLVDGVKVAELWGMRNNNPNMNYEKFSRALRHYYKNGLIIPVPNEKFVYRFGNYKKVSVNEDSSTEKELLSSDEDMEQNPQNKNAKQRPECVWEFLSNLLKDPQYCPSLIYWEDYETKKFRLVDGQKVAELWGLRNNNPNMYYEIFSRELRHYYKDEVIISVPKEKLVYRFGKNAKGIETDNPNFTIPMKLRCERSEQVNEDSSAQRELLSSDEDVEQNPPRRMRGRPRSLIAIRRPKEKIGRVWEFLSNLLKDPQYCPSLIYWEDYETKKFRIVDGQRIAELWGERKNNPNMNLEKFSRTIRHYYKDETIIPVPRESLVYRFGKNAKGIETDNPNFGIPVNLR